MSFFKPSRLPVATGHHLRLRESLIRHGLIRKSGNRRPSGAYDAAVPVLPALRLALQESGDLACLFGLYLSTRIDLLSPEDCNELSRIPDRAAPTPFAELQGFVERELGVEIEQAFLAVEPLPFDTSLLRDSYLAMLQTGENAAVQVLRRQFRSFPEEQLDALRIIADTNWFAHGPRRAATDLIDDFAHELRVRMDSLQEAGTLEALAFDAHTADGLWAPRVIHEFCRSGVLTVEARPSMKVSKRVADDRGLFGAGSALPRARNIPADKLARVLCMVWLRQAFHGRVLPVQFGLDDISLLESGEVAFLGGAFSAPPADAKESLWKYMLAVAADDPDECCRSLLGLMLRPEAGELSQELLASFRQAVTCFMSGPGESDFYTGLAARILRHLQLATQLGYRPLPSLVAFYRGLFSALAASRALQPFGDPLLEAVEAVWVLGIFGSARQMIGMDALTNIGSKYVAAMVEFPMRLDAMLSQSVHEKNRASFERTAGSHEPFEHTYSIAIVLLLAAVLLLVRSGPLHFAQAWVDGVSFVVCCLIGLLVLGMAARS